MVPLDDSPTLTEMVPFDIIATAALVELGVIASDETPIPTDQALMLDKVASVHAALDAQGVVWRQPGSVPRAFVEDYTKLTAAQAASSFGKAVDPAIVVMLEGRIRKGAMVLSADDNAQQAVQAVHDDLVMRGIARWSSLDIPNALADPYATLAADALGAPHRRQYRPEQPRGRDGRVDLPVCGFAHERRDRGPGHPLTATPGGTVASIRFCFWQQLLWQPAVALPQARAYADRSGTITAGGTAQVVLPAWTGRHGCVIQNQSSANLWVSETAAAIAGPPAILIPAGQQFLCMSPASGQAYSIIGATTAQAFAAREW